MVAEASMRAPISNPRGAAAQAPLKWFRGADVPWREIRKFVREVAAKFQPDKIILFGSYASGEMHADSDVDVLVIMPARNQLSQAAKIHLAIKPPFPLHLLVRTPAEVKWRMTQGDDFIREVMQKGKRMYESPHQGMGRKGRRGLPGRKRVAASSTSHS
jgi:predicted nucleotidyltransferase